MPVLALPVTRFRAVLSIAATAFGLLALPAAAQTAPRDECAACHVKLDSVRLAAPAQTYKDDIHAARGFSCAECHGGDPRRDDIEGMAAEKGFVGKPTGRQVLQICGRCHSDAALMKRYNPALRVDQVAEYATSVHGQRLLGTGDRKVATCVSCHTAHQIRPPSDTRSTVNAINVSKTCGACHSDSAYMKQYGIPTDQQANYRKSVHWKALQGGDRSAPTCNDCHGNHGAAPPGVNSVANVCGQCHSSMADYFAKSKHGEIFVQAELPGCATCHSNHDVVVPTDTALGFTEGTICGRCHSEGDEGALAALAMRAAIDSLKGGVHLADSLLTTAEQAGMEVSQPQFDLRNANSTLLQARGAVHTFIPDSVRAHTAEGMKIAAAAVVRGRGALEDLRFRRLGLSVSGGIILLLVAGLLLKIRQLEEPGRQAGTSGPSITGGRS